MRYKFKTLIKKSVLFPIYYYYSYRKEVFDRKYIYYYFIFNYGCVKNEFHIHYLFRSFLNMQIESVPIFYYFL